jgi:hypothetical protein
MMLDKIDSLNETLAERSDLMERACKKLERDDKEGALCVVMGWISTKRLKEMVEFWEERDK